MNVKSAEPALKDLKTLRQVVALANELARLPDDAQVSAGTAALLISVDAPPSERTMEGWRQGRNRGGETGPPFHAGPGRTSPGSYNVGEVRAWVRAQRVSTTMEASARRGLTFATVADLSRPEPWVLQSDYVVGHALTVSPAELENALRGEAGAVLRIAGLSDVMLGTTWSDPSVCRVFHAAYGDVLRAALESADAVLDATDLHEGMVAAVGSEALACPKCGRPAHPEHPCRL
ncbi:hypothetical protein BAC2_00160 [uncultured bacterium]|nr:hypothetical protein BAC2_00160 [uncultured bacterium]